MPSPTFPSAVNESAVCSAFSPVSCQALQLFFLVCRAASDWVSICIFLVIILLKHFHVLIGPWTTSFVICPVESLTFSDWVVVFLVICWCSLCVTYRSLWLTVCTAGVSSLSGLPFHSFNSMRTWSFWFWWSPICQCFLLFCLRNLCPPLGHENALQCFLLQALLSYLEQLVLGSVLN